MANLVLNFKMVNQICPTFWFLLHFFEIRDFEQKRSTMQPRYVVWGGNHESDLAVVHGPWDLENLYLPPIILQKKLLNGPLKGSNGDAFMEDSQTKVPPPYVIGFLL